MKRICCGILAVLLVMGTVPNAAAAERDVTNILVIGTDERSNSFSANARSDCVMLVSMNPKAKTVKLVSFERGMGVPVLEGKHKGQWDWLTHIFRYGGASLLIKTLNDCFDLDIQHYVRVNFQTVTNGVDALGGIRLELSDAEAEYLELGSGGLHRLNGEQALSFARLRQIDSDWQRIERQRRVIIAGAEELKHLELGELKALVTQVLPLVQTNLSPLEIGKLLLLAPELRQAEFSQLTIPQEGTYRLKTGMEGRSYFAADFSKNTEILREFLYET